MKTIDKILDNAFKVKKNKTKGGVFKFNEFTRTVTHLNFFQLLADSDINLKSHELVKYMCYLGASDYVYNWNGDATLVVSKDKAYIIIGSSLESWIDLDFVKFTNTYKWFKDESIFMTDFGRIYKSEKYYLKK